MWIGEVGWVLAILTALCLPQDYNVGKPTWEIPIPVLGSDDLWFIGEAGPESKRAVEKPAYKVSFRLRAGNHIWAGSGERCVSGEPLAVVLAHPPLDFLDPTFPYSLPADSRIDEARPFVVATITEEDNASGWLLGSMADRQVRIDVAVDGLPPRTGGLIQPQKLQTYRFREKAPLGEVVTVVLGRDGNGEPNAWLDITVEDGGLEVRARNDQTELQVFKFGPMADNSRSAPPGQNQLDQTSWVHRSHRPRHGTSPEEEAVEVQAYDVHILLRSKGRIYEGYRRKILDSETAWFDGMYRESEFEPGLRIGGRWQRQEHFHAVRLEATITGVPGQSTTDASSMGERSVDAAITVDGRWSADERRLVSPALVTPHRAGGKITLGRTATFVLSKDEEGEPEVWVEVTVEDAGVTKCHRPTADAAETGSVWSGVLADSGTSSSSHRQAKLDAYGLQLRLIHQREHCRETVFQERVSIRPEVTTSVDEVDRIGFGFRGAWDYLSWPRTGKSINVTLRRISDEPIMAMSRLFECAGPHAEIDLNVAYTDLFALSDFRPSLSLNRQVNGRLTLMATRAFVLQEDQQRQPLVWIEATLLELPDPDEQACRGDEGLKDFWFRCW